MNSVVLRFALLLSLLMAAPLARAESYFVTDRVLAELRAQPDPRAPVIATLPTGTPLEVQSRSGDFMQVTAPGNKRGWIYATMVSAEEPAMVSLLRLRDDQARAHAELEEMRTKKTEASLWALVVTAIGALMIGFGLGVLWLDHRNRSRHGGFRL
jgi:hypothetical protein